MSALIKAITHEDLIDMRVKRALARKATVFNGMAKDIFDGSADIPKAKTVVMKSAKWDQSEGEFAVWNDFHNMRNRIIDGKTKQTFATAQAPDPSDIADLIGQFFIDVTRRAMESPDLTDRITQEVVNVNFPRTPSTQEFLPYRGEFTDISGNGDNFPTIQQALGNTDTATLGLKGLGWETTLENLLFNPVHNLQKVSQAVSDAYTDARNAQTVGRIVGATYVASQSVAPVEIADSSYQVKLYQTLLEAYRTLVSLKDYQTDRKISTAPGITLLINSANQWDIESVVNGQLSDMTNGVFQSMNMRALPIREILVYDQGINNGFTFKNKTMSYPGVTAGEAYMFVPRAYNWLLTKRPLTMETSLPNAMTTLREQRSWYYSQGTYDKYFLGSSNGLGWDAGYGAVVKITLPDENDNT